MYVCRSGDILRVDAPAKLNLFLEVIGRRPDGFHELETLMVPVTLYDTLFCQCTTSTDIQLECDWARGVSSCSGSSPPLPDPTDNLVYHALRTLAEAGNVRCGMRVRLVKRIPAEAGLGGASSDAAAALLAANDAWQLTWSVDQLSQVAAQLGSDVPFFLFHAAAVCRGRGEQIEPITVFPQLHIVVVKPPVGLSTPEVYAVCRPSHARGTEPLLQAAARGEICRMTDEMKNDLEPAASQLTPWIARLRDEFQQLGFIKHQMSGSGSSYFGIARNREQARRMARSLRARKIGRVMHVRTTHQPYLAS